MATYEKGQWSDTTATTVIEVVTTCPAAAVHDNDVVADTQEIANAVRVDGGTGVIHSLVVHDATDSGPELDIIFLQTNEGVGTENAAVDMSDAEAREILGIVNIATGDWVDLINGQLATKTSVGLVIKAAAASTSIYVAIVTRDAFTSIAASFVLQVGILQD
jgi:hypothetical protein